MQANRNRASVERCGKRNPNKSACCSSTAEEGSSHCGQHMNQLYSIAEGIEPALSITQSGYNFMHSLPIRNRRIWTRRVVCENVWWAHNQDIGNADWYCLDDNQYLLADNALDFLTWNLSCPYHLIPHEMTFCVTIQKPSARSFVYYGFLHAELSCSQKFRFACDRLNSMKQTHCIHI